MSGETPATIVEFEEEELTPRPPSLRWWQLVAVVLLVVLCDLAIYRGEGFAGYAALIAVAPFLMCAVTFRPRRYADLLIVAGMLGLLAVRMAMCGWSLQNVLGFALLAAFAMTLSGLRPHVLEAVLFTSQTVMAGYLGIDRQWQSVKSRQPSRSGRSWLRWAFPAAAFLAFGMLFILANPDLMATFGEQAEWFFLNLREWLVEFGPHPQEILFWLAVLWVAVGALRPLMRSQLLQEKHSEETRTVDETPASNSNGLYSPIRNMLVTVIALFAAYLVFEFKTHCFREFRKGF